MLLENIRRLVQDDLAATDHLISQCLESNISLIHQLGEHIVASGGKRLRPLLVILSARAFDYQGTDHQEMAAIIELIHTATLLHDDVVDTSTLRRGQQTANAIWGNEASVLVGDYLYSRCFQMMVKIGHMPLMAVLANATNTIAEGEVLQLMNCKDIHLTENRYLEVIRNKTGMLFSAAAQSGAVLCQRSPAETKAMADFGLHLGITFQLIDDALDYQADVDRLGKNTGDDLAEGKVTLPLIHALKHGNADQVQTIQQAIQSGNRDLFTAVCAAIESTQAIAYTYQIAEQHVAEAIRHLSMIPESPYRDALDGLAQFALNRNH